jgi:lysylphosphatidylglycerol synthetase-like protein (DUF2156 family)
MESDYPPAVPLTLGVPLAGAGSVPPVREPSPLSEADFFTVRQAAAEYAVVGRTVARARRSATITLVVGVLAVLCALACTQWFEMVTALVVCAVGVVESIGAHRLRREQPGAARMLCLNQVGFLTLIVAYCVIQMLTFSSAKAKDAALSPEVRTQLEALPDMLKSIDGQIDRLAPLAMFGLYGGTIVLSGLIQGALARSYHVCGHRLASFHSHTPAWVCRLLREALAG